MAFKLSEFFAQAAFTEKLTISMATGAFALAFLLIVSALGIYTYEIPFDPKKDYIRKLGDLPPEDSNFLDERIVDIAVAHSRNSGKNDIRAQLLMIASWAIFTGVAAAFGSLLVLYW